MDNRRVGQFRIMADYVNENPEMVLKMMAALGAIVVRCELLYGPEGQHQFEYWAMSDKFLPVVEGGIVPSYVLEVSYSDGNMEVSVELRSDI